MEILLSHAPLNETNSVPAQEWRKGYNLTTLKQHYYVKETVELIYSLIPDMDRLAFISDDRYISEETRGDVKEAVEKHFPKPAFRIAFYHSLVNRNASGHLAQL